MPRALPALERRGEILDQSFGLFAARGYHALSMRDLARELGASTGVLYHWFPGKSELYTAMLERQVARQVGEALALILPAADRVAATEAYVADHADDLLNTLLVAIDWFRAEPQARPAVAAALEAYRAALAGDVGMSAADADRFLSLTLGRLLQRALNPASPLEGQADAGREASR